MQNWIISIIERFGYLGIFLLILLENIFPPIPSEIILTFSGFMTTITQLSTIGIIAVSTLSSYIGAIVLYIIGRGIHHIKNILGFHSKHIEKSYNYLLQNGKKSIFIGRLVPVVRSVISIPAGMVRIPFFIYSLYTILGTLLWNSILTFLGVIAGTNWEIISMYFDKYSWLILVIVIVLIIVKYIKKRL